MDIETPPGTGFATAAFRWWHPPLARLRAVAVLVPGSNHDGRDQVDDPFWRGFAERCGCALVGCWFRDHPHPDMQIEHYARAGDGSGQALLDAVAQLARASGQPHLAEAPLLLWGHSAGGEFNFEFVCWKPERVLLFVVNKGGYYFTHLAPEPARRRKGLFFIGGKDAAFRIKSLEGIHAVNRQAGADWELIIEADEGHGVGRSRDIAIDRFAAALGQQVP